MSEQAGVAFVLGGGGILGSTQVGMLRALIERGIRPDLIVGTSVGALNGALIAAEPSLAAVHRLSTVWTSLSESGVFSSSVFSQAARLARHRTHLHSAEPLRALLDQHLPVRLIEELPVAFQTVAASIERASAHWFTAGPITDAVLASCAVPGLLPPAAVGDEHFLDGGLVDSIPVGRAVAMGMREVYVLHVGRIEQPLTPPRWPWQVGLVAFEIARRHRFVEDLASVPDGIRVHLLPSGAPDTPGVSVRYRNTSRVLGRIERAHQASGNYLDGVEQHR
jgi:NTE family protein